MKKFIIVLFLGSLVAIGACSGASNSGVGSPAATSPAASQPKPSQTAKAISVANFAADPGAYTGEITLTGIAVDPGSKNPSMFTMVDTTEVEFCKSTACAGYYLPVRYAGKLPQGWDVVNVTDTLTSGVFEADSIQVLEHLNLGAVT